MVEVLQKDVGDRVVIDGLLGRKVGWLSDDGRFRTTTLKVGMLEIPRCFHDKVVAGDLEAHAGVIALATGMEIHTLVRWAGGELALREHSWRYGPSVGLLLVQP